jgi:hypothetical protein
MLKPKAPPPWEVQRRKECANAAQQYDHWNDRYMNALHHKLTPAQLDEARQQFHYWNKRYIELRSTAE